MDNQKQFAHILDGKKNGEYKEYRENGQLYVICSYTDDKVNGEYKSYYEDGQLEEIFSYTDDRKNGGELIED